jgi:hypothetical protein
MDKKLYRKDMIQKNQLEELIPYLNPEEWLAEWSGIEFLISYNWLELWFTLLLSKASFWQWIIIPHVIWKLTSNMLSEHWLKKPEYVWNAQRAFLIKKQIAFSPN